MARAFVTGGSGFIGRALVRRLREEGHEVRALVRSDASADAVAALGARPVRGELTDPASWQDGLAGSEVLFHLAAETDINASRERQEQITVGGTGARLPARRRVLLSVCGSTSIPSPAGVRAGRSRPLAR